MPIFHSASVHRGVGQREGVLRRLISDDAAQRKLVLSAARDCLETAQYDEVRQAGGSWMRSLRPWPSLRVSICALWMEVQGQTGCFPERDWMGGWDLHLLT